MNTNLRKVQTIGSERTTLQVALDGQYQELPPRIAEKVLQIVDILKDQVSTIIVTNDKGTMEVYLQQKFVEAITTLKTLL